MTLNCSYLHTLNTIHRISEGKEEIKSMRYLNSKPNYYFSFRKDNFNPFPLHVVSIPINEDEKHFKKPKIKKHTSKGNKVKSPKSIHSPTRVYTHPRQLYHQQNNNISDIELKEKFFAFLHQKRFLKKMFYIWVERFLD